MRLLRSFDIWERKQDYLLRYRCFEDVEAHSFCVQSMDYYYAANPPEHFENLDRQHIDLLLEQDPFERSGSFPSIEEAIRTHNEKFSPNGTEESQ